MLGSVKYSTFNPRMKTYILFLFFPLIGLSGIRHDYHLAFFELEFNPETYRFEASLKVTAHDLAFITSKKHHADFSINKILNDSLLHKEIDALILTGFTLWNEQQSIYFSIENLELNKQGDIVFYLISEPTKNLKNLSFAFPLLTDYFPDQQNKLTYLNKGKQYTVTFLSSDFRKNINNTP